METVSSPDWRKASRSNDTGGNCVEVAAVTDPRQAG
ncbi:MAG: hypothetical protein JWR24_868 [Actinoallomurus sp.]|jgi:hypothetical protein|nr:hypothetical protein [Actinoallomurus sp.]